MILPPIPHQFPTQTTNNSFHSIINVLSHAFIQMLLEKQWTDKKRVKRHGHKMKETLSKFVISSTNGREKCRNLLIILLHVLMTTDEVLIHE
jgi:hypothetical protein